MVKARPNTVNGGRGVEVLLREGQTLDTLQRRDLVTRELHLRAETIDEANRSVEAVIATENVVQVFDMETFRLIDEVLLAEGAELPDQIVLLDSHMRFWLNTVRGSIRELRREGRTVVGRIFFADDEDSLRAWSLVRDGHVTDVSAGYRTTEYTDIAPGKSETVNGRRYTAGKRTLRITTKWKPREGSLVPIGADDAAKVREETVMTNGKSAGGGLADTLNGLIADQVTTGYPRTQIVRELAESADITQREVKDILGGRDEPPSREQVEGFAAVLETSVDELDTAA